ncbi:MAG: very short patch repair endonuclease [Pseudomonadota bacterium]|nr:very short patch repair endonuclease [Pseudomonadota bacterium]
MDRLSPERRSALMARIRGKDTAPEMLVRGLVHSLGFRYRLHSKDLPGSPDLVFKGRKKAIFVHGCFWHRHRCPRGTVPSTRMHFWLSKLEGNRLRDVRAQNELRRLGWSCLVVWECELKNLDRISARISRFLVFKED